MLTIISDPKILKIPIKENNDPLVDLLETSILCDNSSKNLSSVTKEFSKLRKTVFKKLLKAQSFLPKGIYLFVKEGYRPISFQKKIFNQYKNKLRIQNPDLDEERLFIEASLFIAPPDIVPPHSTGGALDLVLVDQKKQELDLGGFPDNNSSYSDSCKTAAKNISKIAKHNRKILLTAMKKVGFINYPYEWWHYSYGDRYWAYVSKNPTAFYGSI